MAEENTAHPLAGTVWKQGTRHVRVERVAVRYGMRYAYVVRCGIDGQVYGPARHSWVRLDDKGRLNRYRLTEGVS